MDAADIADWNAHHDFDVIIAFGGDGTINEVVNGLVGSEAVLGVIPCGTGNDYAREIGIPKDIRAAVRILLQHHVQTHDVGEFQGRYFANAIGFGFDAKVNEIAQRMKYLKGTAVYIASIIQSLWKYNAIDMEVHMNGTVLQEKTYLVAAGNGTSVAGGVKLTPAASLNDSLLDICHVEDVSVGTIVRHVPKLFDGRIGEVKQVTLSRSPYLQIETDTHLPIHMDGEILVSDTTSYLVNIRPGTVRVITQKPDLTRDAGAAVS
jgi:YegS/Rv2252/BmrU family lipid kinase